MLTEADDRHDYFRLIRSARKLDQAACRERLRVALLADCATQHLTLVLKALFAEHGVAAEVYQGEYDAIELESFDPGSSLYAFEPQAIVIINAANALKERFYAQPAERSSFATSAAARTRGIWEAIRRQSSALIVQTTWVLPYERVAGHQDAARSDTLVSSAARLNALVADASRTVPAVLIADLDRLAAYHGYRAWADEKLWFLARSLCSLEHLPHAARSIVDVVLAARGKVVKAVVVDLDNTLWGGEVGEDGVDGIRIGRLGEGEAFTAFQQFLLELKRRGIVLAVCSKNDYANAIAPFREHPDMVLREGDIPIFVANWDDKATNLQRIAARLNVGADSIVFLDDSPFERSLVREQIPAMIVPDLPADPANFVKALMELNLFESGHRSEADADRADLYLAEAQRSVEAERFGTLDERTRLQSLEMKAVVEPFDRHHLPRIAQLMQRSNQFNLMTRRFNERDCELFMQDGEGHVALYVTLRDRLGDSGLVAALVLQVEGTAATIREWVMSCRVFGRGVEQHTMNALVELARRRGLTRLVGEYVPTPKNGLVQDLYSRLGFSRGAERDGTMRWLLDLEAHQPAPVHIERDIEEKGRHA